MKLALLVLVACSRPPEQPRDVPIDHVTPITAAGVEAPSKPARQELHDVQLLRDVSPDRLLAAMQSMQPSVGLRCPDCHVVGNYRADTARKQKTRDMIRLTDEIEQRTFNNTPRVTCWTCHRGQPKPPPRPMPSALPRTFTTMTDAELDRPVEQAFKDVRILTGMSVRTFGTLMTWFASELGVTCTHCHVHGDFAAMTPTKQRAREMLEMTAYIGKDFYANKSPIMCGTCHAGERSPRRKP